MNEWCTDVTSVNWHVVVTLNVNVDEYWSQKERRWTSGVSHVSAGVDAARVDLHNTDKTSVSAGRHGIYGSDLNVHVIRPLRRFF